MSQIVSLHSLEPPCLSNKSLNLYFSSYNYYLSSLFFYVFIGLLGVFRALVMISHSHSDSEAEPPCGSETRASTAEKLYQTFIISVPVSSAFIILFFFYLCYLRRQRANWSSLQMPPSYANNNDISRVNKIFPCPFPVFQLFV